ncbi:triacylglycerol lipase 2-like isoform X2 [Tripterygium wilfordii]|uniref:triacylglycerol lipase 2-like isoform X2 n=1 Tax=Tripterygium wilfordii TaxID=458696 RepID=UPI0018F82992|nr:triacylglycerol lipase 2-like isoform X2 [Tripterygium wilfordii]
MANTSYTLIVLILFCMSAAATARTKLHSIHDQDGMPRSSLVADGGICKSTVETQGYDCHEHKVTTQDGYILSMQRIPAGRSGNTADKPPVLLQHGILMDGASWLVTSPNQSLAFMLADNGFDVWLASTRGTKYSRGHVSLTPDDQSYWDWTWDQLAAYDLPAFVGHVQNQTGQKLHYVGHSLGTLTVLAALSQKKLLNMLRSAVLLSPIAHTEHIGSLLLRVAADIFLANDLYWHGVNEFVPGGDAVENLLEHLCKIPWVNCTNLASAITGPNCCVKASTLEILFKHEPHPSSTKNFIHLSQMIRTGTVAMYDYGIQNMKKYGQMTPPLYNLTNIPKDFPLFFSYGGMDYLSDTKDVQSLLHILRSHKADKRVLQFIKEYAHLDFIIV